MLTAHQMSVLHREAAEGYVGMAVNDAGKTIAAVDRATDVLTLFTRTSQETLGVTEIAAAVGLSKAVVHRILTTLAAKGYVQIDEQSRRYSLGPAALTLGLTYLDRIEVRTLARPALVHLSRVTEETATLSIRNGPTRVYIDQVAPAREVKMLVQLGQPFPLHAGSSSKAFLAFLRPDQQDDYLGRRLMRLTEATVTDAARLRRELADIRAAGYATSVGERQVGAASVAAPVLDHAGEPVAVVSVCGPVERFSDTADHAARALLDATQDLSRQLGYQRHDGRAVRRPVV